MSADLQIERATPADRTWATARSRTTSREISWLAVLLLVTLLKGIGWAFLVYPLDAPDEPSHFNAVMQIHMNRALPAIVLAAPNFMRTPPSTPQDPVTRSFLEHYGFNSFRAMPYESSQPPLYYAAAAVMLAPLGEDRLSLLYAARLVSVLFGVGAVLALWLAARLIWPETPFLHWAVPLVMTLVPQFTFVTSTVTNDAAVLFFGAALLAVWAGGLSAAQDGGKVVIWKWALLAGLVTALGLLSKLTMAVTIPGTALWLWWLAGERYVALAQRLRSFVVGGLASAVVVVLGVGWWVARNYSLYGEATGSGSVFNVYHKIYWTRLGYPLNQLYSFFPLTPFGDPRGGFVLLTFISTWANFGWQSVVIFPLTYVLMALLCIAGLVGLVRLWKAGPRRPISEESSARRRLAWLCMIAIAGGFLLLLAYNSFVDYQPQGRYLFVAFAPLMLLLVAGLWRATSRMAVNKALIYTLLGALLVMQVLSVLALMSQYAKIVAQG